MGNQVNQALCSAWQATIVGTPRKPIGVTGSTKFCICRLLELKRSGFDRTTLLNRIPLVMFTGSLGKPTERFFFFFF